MKIKIKAHGLVPILVLIGCFALLPKVPAVVPPPDGGYANFTTAEGQNALFSLTTGSANTAVGWFSLFSDAAGAFNTATGAGTLLFNTADNNTALGTAALLFNTTGHSNTAVGTAALLNNIAGIENVAVGFEALQSNTTIGGSSGIDNIAVGTRALQNNTTGAFNTAIGGDVLNMITTTHDNTAVGAGAMALSTGANNTAVGRQAGFSSGAGNNNVYLGSNMNGVSGENDHTYIRNVNTTSVSGMGTDTVTVNVSTGLLGHATSSQRYKENVKPMENTSETLYRLKPVTYRYKKEIDSTQSLDYGLIAEQVAQVDPNLAIRDRNGQIDSVRYSAINAMLLNEFLREHKAFLEEQSKVQNLEAALRAVNQRLKEQEAKIERVSAQIEVRKPVPHVVQIP